MEAVSKRLWWWLIERVPGAAENIFDFVADQVFDLVAGGAEDICAGQIPLDFRRTTLRMAAVMARRRSVSMLTLVQPVRRATSMSASGTPAVSSAQFAAVFVDFLGQFLRHARSAVQHQRIIAQPGIHQRLLDQLETFQIQMLFALEFVGAV